MIERRFDHGWRVRRRTGPFVGLDGPPPEWRSVTLPHDAMLAAGRDPDGDPAVAFHRGGAYEYERHFVADDEWRHDRVALRFEGVYRDAVVVVNGDVVAHQPNGYAELLVPLDDHLRQGAENVVRVECRSGDDSRWYSGAGIHRPVTLLTGPAVHIVPDGVVVSTPELDTAVVEVTVHNATPRRVTIAVDMALTEGGRVVGADRQPLTIPSHGTATARARIVVPGARPWSPAEPALHECRVVAGQDEAVTTFGFRTISVDNVRGFRLNGEPLNLRGACIHADHGVLGAATFAEAERRRVGILRRAGFNAVRSAHQPASRALLDACDREGVLVMDEAWDMWGVAKRDHDHALRFADRWRADLESMVTKDRNHPSVVMYSIGNEIPEIASTGAAVTSRALAEHLRAADPTRPITNGVNLFLPVLSDGLLNDQLEFGTDVVASDQMGDWTAEAFAALDVAGYNYAEVRYAADRQRFPHRVIVGSETFPRDIARNWQMVLDHDHLIGDFTWTGWDYLGEVGLGRVEYDADAAAPSADGLAAAYPWRYAACGDIDVTGHRLPVSYFREIVVGLRSEPFIAVRPPEHHGARPRFSTPWSWSSAVASWTWERHAGRPVTVEVYADADEVELLLDGRTLGRARIEQYRAELEAVYQPGELVAIARRDGVETGRTSLRTATGALQLRLSASPDRFTDVAFVVMELVDALGTVHTGADREVEVRVDGPAELLGLGSAAAASEESFLEPRCRLYRGRALAVVRATGSGPVEVSVSSPGCELQSAGLSAGSALG